MNKKLFSSRLSASTVVVNNQQVTNDTYIKNGRIMIPFRKVLEAIGVSRNTILWNEEAETVTVIHKDRVIIFKINSNIATINGISITIETPPELKRGNIYIPLKFISGALGANLEWDNNKTIIITTSNPSIEVTVNLPNDMKYIEKSSQGKIEKDGKLYNENGTVQYNGKFVEGSFNGSAQTSNESNLNLNTISELQNYLNENYSTLHTTIGETHFKFRIDENTSTIFPWDYSVRVDYDRSFFFNIQYSYKLSSDQREHVKQELKDYQMKIANFIIKMMPDKKIYGGYHKSWYRYPNIKVDLIARNYFSWANYDHSSNDLEPYSDTKHSTFRWDDSLDDKF